ncbi:hypothetical protein C9426_13675 [Serratia sp. S1B]|nr:hypothetical protein C9426_13675 [Serratia sp. S1B]
MLKKIVPMCLGIVFCSASWADCSPQFLEEVNQTTRNALIQLQNINDANNEDGIYDGSVSPVASKQIQRVKQAIVDGIDLYFRCSNANSEDIQSLPPFQQLITVPSSSTQNNIPYGANPTLEITRQGISPDIYLIRVGFNVQCGDDNILLAYQFHDGKWRRILRWQSDEYQQTSAAHGDNYTYQLLAPVKKGELPLVAVAHGTPWCTSNLSMALADVIQMASDDKQQILFSGAYNYFRGMEPPGIKLKDTQNGFELRMYINMLDTRLRKAIYRYQFDGKEFQRVQPAAMNGRDFVDEWLQVDKETARQWSHPSQADALVQQQKALRDHFDSYGPVRRCEGTPERYQVEVKLNQSDATHSQPAQSESDAFFIIQPINNGFMMQSVATKADPNCNGPDIMAKKSD